MLDEILQIIVFLGPLAMAIGVEVISKEIRQNPFWRIGVVALGVLLSVVSGIEIHRSSVQAEKDKEDLRDKLNGQTETTKAIQATLNIVRLEDASNLAYLRGRLDELKVPTVGNIGQEVARVLGAQNLSNKALAANAIELARQMRTFEMQRKNEEEVLEAKREAGITRWGDYSMQLEQHYNETVSLFRNEYLGKAIYYRDEMQRRLGTPPLTIQEKVRLLAFDGLISGPSPASDAADYLEKLARQLLQK
jgi:hypothetical protein